MVPMAESPVEIVKLLSVALTWEKQKIVEAEFEKYTKATNYTIKAIYKRHLTNPQRTVDTLLDEITRKFVCKPIDSTETPNEKIEILHDKFGKRFEYSLIKEIIDAPEMSAEDIRNQFAIDFSNQYVHDIVKTARVEIGEHRGMAKTIRSMRDEIPYFKPGRMILSGLLVGISEKACDLLTTSGKRVPIPYDKRSRNRVTDRLLEIKDKKGKSRKYGRVRFSWNREGYVDIDIKLK